MEWSWKLRAKEGVVVREGRGKGEDKARTGRERKKEDNKQKGRVNPPGNPIKCLLGVYNSSTSLIKTQRAECELLD
jgi:hypothetical protein